MSEQPPHESDIPGAPHYADRIRSVYVEKKEVIAAKVDRIRGEISEKIRLRLTELNEHMTKLFEWLKAVKNEGLDQEQQENLRRVIDFQCTRMRKKLDSLYRWNVEAQKVQREDEDSREK